MAGAGFGFSVERRSFQLERVRRPSAWLEAPGEVRASKGDEIDLGSDPRCSVVLGDPVVQATHARIRLRGEQFLVEDLATATGTYLNGSMVSGARALQHGDELVLGSSRVTIQLRDPAGQAARTQDGRLLTTLVLDECAFRFVPKSREIFSRKEKKKNEKGDAKAAVEGPASVAPVAGDSPADTGPPRPDDVAALATKDQWVYAERRFGKSRALLVANGLAVVGALLLPFGLFTDAGKELVNPGALSRCHAAAELSCGACHDPLDGPTLERCGGCHADIVEAWRHPFQHGPAAAFAALTGECQACHREHQGPVSIPAAPPTCDTSGCHEQEMTAEVAAAKLVTRELAGRGSTPRPVRIGFNEFSHASHLAEGLAIGCADCHEPAAGALDSEEPCAQRSGREFAQVGFERCKACHALDRDAWIAKGWSDAEPPLYGMLVEWHGSADPAKCTQCHEDDFQSGRLKSVNVPRLRPKAFDLARRDHQAEFEDQLGSRDCAECHVKASVEPKAGKGAQFWHGLHLAALTPGELTPSDELSRDCRDCHAGIEHSRTLADVKLPGTDAVTSVHCAECHVGAENRALAISAAGFLDASASERVDFPHAAHMEMELGCFSCHAFDHPTDLWGAKATPIDDPDCRKCHAHHRDIGGGACARCHGFEERWRVDPNDGRKHGVWRGEALYKDWRNGGAVQLDSPPEVEPSRFRHYSEGHRQATTTGACQECHGGEAGTPLARAGTILDVPIPQETDDLCRKCHVLEKLRFHWE